MALSVKAALLTCLFFVGGMCWLVSQVSRPLVELPSPLKASDSNASVRSAEPKPSRDPLALTERLERASPIAAQQERAANAHDAGALVLDPSARPAISHVELPPLLVERAPPEAPSEGAALAAAELLGPASQDAPLVEVVRARPVPEAVLPLEAGSPLAASAAGAGETRKPEAMRGASAVEPPEARHYLVRRGDTLMKIVRREMKGNEPGGVALLLEANPELRERPHRLKVGEVIQIPLANSAGVVAVQAMGSAAAEAANVASGGAVGPAIPPVKAAVQADSRDAAARKAAKGGKPGDSKLAAKVRWYTIRERDSLFSIARKHLQDPKRWKEIAELNGVRDARKLSVGMRIKLPGNDT